MKIEVNVFNDKNEKIAEHVEMIPEAKKVVGRFMVLPDGWIRDFAQGLDWGLSSTKSMNYKDSDNFCISSGGRMPTRKELDNLLDLTKKSGVCIDTDYFKDTKLEYYWTSDPVAWASYPARWVVGFSLGGVGNSDEDYNCYARPVRASQC